ncbi:MAG: hypothetical protein M3347_13760 [Armatimonadota bacterium]|nr:hypothetical protein [Armatimonadota bacterium]
MLLDIEFENTEQPVPGPDAFGETHSAALQSQAALFLLMGTARRADDRVLEARAMASGAFTNETLDVDALDNEDMEALNPLPRLQGSFERIEPALAAATATRLRGRRRREQPMLEQPTPRRLRAAAKTVYEDPTVPNGAMLLEMGLRHPYELPRVAAAVSYFDISAAPARALPILVRGALSPTPLVREVATTALARLAPEQLPAVQFLQDNATAAVASLSASLTSFPVPHESFIVHGTFARTAAWWQPGGDFHTYIRQNIFSDLYAQPDRYEWSGGYSDGARAVAAADLQAWVNGHGFNRPHIFAHSHGGNVAMLASQNGLDIGELILLAVPVHAHKYMPDFNHVSKAVSIRVRMDLVILADRGGQKFNHPQIQENVLPVWFDHGAPRKPHIWQKYNVPAML